MTTVQTTAESHSQAPSAWRLLAAVGFVLGATAFTVQAFVQSTAGAQPGPDYAVQELEPQVFAPCAERPIELTFATNGSYLLEVGALAPCELGVASTEG